MPEKHLHLGISDFREIGETDYCFVDKTTCIEETVEAPAKVMLLARPARGASFPPPLARERNGP
jgi:hypothetical protein